MSKSVVERQQEFKKAQRKRGLVQVRVWVPEEDREKLILEATRMREEHHKYLRRRGLS